MNKNIRNKSILALALLTGGTAAAVSVSSLVEANNIEQVGINKTSATSNETRARDYSITKSEIIAGATAGDYTGNNGFPSSSPTIASHVEFATGDWMPFAFKLTGWGDQVIADVNAGNKLVFDNAYVDGLAGDNPTFSTNIDDPNKLYSELEFEVWPEVYLEQGTSGADVVVFVVKIPGVKPNTLYFEGTVWSKLLKTYTTFFTFHSEDPNTGATKNKYYTYAPIVGNENKGYTYTSTAKPNTFESAEFVSKDEEALTYSINTMIENGNDPYFWNTTEGKYWNYGDFSQQGTDANGNTIYTGGTPESNQNPTGALPLDETTLVTFVESGKIQFKADVYSKYGNLVEADHVFSTEDVIVDGTSTTVTDAVISTTITNLEHNRTYDNFQVSSDNGFSWGVINGMVPITTPASPIEAATNLSANVDEINHVVEISMTVKSEGTYTTFDPSKIQIVLEDDLLNEYESTIIYPEVIESDLEVTNDYTFKVQSEDAFAIGAIIKDAKVTYDTTDWGTIDINHKTFGEIDWTNATTSSVMSADETSATVTVNDVNQGGDYKDLDTNLLKITSASHPELESTATLATRDLTSYTVTITGMDLADITYDDLVLEYDGVDTGVTIDPIGKMPIDWTTVTTTGEMIDDTSALITVNDVEYGGEIVNLNTDYLKVTSPSHPELESTATIVAKDISSFQVTVTGMDLIYNAYDDLVLEYAGVDTGVAIDRIGREEIDWSNVETINEVSEDETILKVHVNGVDQGGEKLAIDPSLLSVTSATHPELTSSAEVATRDMTDYVITVEGLVPGVVYDDLVLNYDNAYTGVDIDQVGEAPIPEPKKPFPWWIIILILLLLTIAGALAFLVWWFLQQVRITETTDTTKTSATFTLNKGEELLEVINGRKLQAKQGEEVKELSYTTSVVEEKVVIKVTGLKSQEAIKGLKFLAATEEDKDIMVIGSVKFESTEDTKEEPKKQPTTTNKKPPVKKTTEAKTESKAKGSAQIMLD